jgi:hypothetical protein
MRTRGFGPSLAGVVLVSSDRGDDGGTSELQVWLASDITKEISNADEPERSSPGP